MRKILFLAFFIAATAFAALPPSPDALLISLSPERPAPETDVRATLSFLDGGSAADAEIEWRVNGTVVRKGKGVTAVSFRTGKLGVRTTLTVKVLDGNEAVEKTLVLAPASLVLVAESDGTVPPFYRGKSLFSYHGAMRIAAIPFFASANGARVNPKTLNYTWRIADRVPEGSSGVGRDVFTFYAKVPFRPTEVSVEVATADGSASAEGSILAEAKAPQVALYETHPLYGTLWNKALANNTILTAPEIRITAQPFFFNRADAPFLKYDWKLNAQKVGSPQDESVVFRKEGAEGVAGVAVEVTNPRAMFQFGEARGVIHF